MCATRPGDAAGDALFEVGGVAIGGAAAGPDFIDASIAMARTAGYLAKKGVDRITGRGGTLTAVRNLNYAMNQAKTRKKMVRAKKQVFNVHRRNLKKSGVMNTTITACPEDFLTICEAACSAMTDGKVHTSIGSLKLTSSTHGIADNSFTTVVQCKVQFAPEQDAMGMMNPK